MRPVTLIAFAVLMPCSLVVSGCGSNGRTPQVASVSSVTTTTTLTTSQNGLLAFSDCMRSHGMPNFPDPSASSAATSS